MLAPIRISAPARSPVTLDEAKLHLRVDHTDDDTMISSLIDAATAHLDGWTGILGRCLVEQEWRQDFDTFAPCLPLPLGPIIRITSVTICGNEVDSDSYALRTDVSGRAYSVFNGVSTTGDVSVAYMAGYPTIPEVPADGEKPAIAESSTVPESLKVAILLLVGHWYQSHEAVSEATASALPFAVDALIAPFRRVGV